MLKNIVFDMGNVILDFDPRKMSSFFTNDEKAIDILCAELFSNKEWLALDKGVTDEETALKGICERVPEEYHGLCRDVLYNWYKYFLPIEGSYEVVKELKSRGVGAYMLTNAALSIHEYRKNSPAFDLMDDILISAEEKMLKPDKNIYLRLLEKFGLKAEECLFIDDSEANIRAAEELGFYGLVFDKRDPQSMIRRVDEIIASEQK